MNELNPNERFSSRRDLEVLYTKLKGNSSFPCPNGIRKQTLPKLMISDNLHDKWIKSEGFSGHQHDVGKALLLLTSFRQISHLNSLHKTTITAVIKTKNQSSSCSTQASIPTSPLLAEPSSNPTILLFPSSNTSRKLRLCYFK
ncbi:hypothetical protein AVEN_101664-1 [Araneus ventricosus]|uniref:Uncharacterized protein n=1 Tax=Araneus ventricosus TaxID=182803 RepID=A0A4Y2GLL3_ARAVE|nr:hypothetical protein AVEN_101664-1 [Araneus ventricosus]